MLTRVSLIFLVSLSCLAFHGVDAEDRSAAIAARTKTGVLSPHAASQSDNSRTATYKVDFHVAVAAPAGTKVMKVWLPLPVSDLAQRISNRTLVTLPRQVTPQIETESIHGNTFAYFEFHQPSGAQLIQHRFDAAIDQQNWGVDYATVERPENWPSSFDVYQRPDPRTKEGGLLREVLNEINQSETDVDRLINAIEWVDQHLTYDHKLASLSANPMHALTHRRGHCSDYHGLCSTLARKVGYPSRVLYGLQMFDKGSPSHCKLEVYLPPYGWVPYDLSETQKLALKVAADETKTKQQQSSTARTIKDRTMKGFRENTWLKVTGGVNYRLAPPAANPTTIIRTIYAEADGIALPEPDPSNPKHSTFSWMTIHRVDEVGDASRGFSDVEDPCRDD